MTRTRATKLPAIPGGDDPVFAESVREALEVLLNRRGDPLDSAVTVRMLVNGGLADVRFGDNLGGAGRLPNVNGDGDSPIFLNPTTPGTNPLPTGHLNVRTRAVWDGIMLQWDWPPGNIEYSSTEIYAALQSDPEVFPAFAQAVLVGTSPGNLFVHTNLGLGKTWYYWLRYVGFVAPGATEPPYSLFTPASTGRGVRGTTAADPAYVLGVLSGQISEDQLVIGLNNRIDSVDFYYNAAGVKVPVPTVDVVDENGNLVPGRPKVNNVQNRVLAAVRDVDNDFRITIAQEAAIRQLDDNTIAASYSVRADVDGYVVGFGFLATRTDPNGSGIPTGPLGATDPQFDSSFVVRANRFAVVHPNEPGNTLPEMVPFIVGLVDGIATVGINGQLVVDGTITARHIQANTIGAAQINATEVWAGVVSANRVFASTFATSGDLNWRVEIGGQAETYPFWYGQGEKGGPNSAFYFDREGNTTLAGNLTVSGAGRFSTAGGAGDGRVEIGGAVDNNVFWMGAGPRTNENAKLRFDRDGNIFIRGLALTIPVAGGTGNVYITVIPRAGSDSSPVLAFGTGVVLEQGDEDDNKEYTVQLWIGPELAAEYRCVSMDEECLPVSISGVAQLRAGTHQIRMTLANVEYDGGGGGLVISSATLSGFQVEIPNG